MYKKKLIQAQNLTEDPTSNKETKIVNFLEFPVL